MLKIQKRRRRSLDESLINPIKAFVGGSNRARRQSTTDTGGFQRGSIFYNSDRRLKKSETDIMARFQDTTKERIRSAVTRTASFKAENEGGDTVRKSTPTMLRRISRHLIRAYSDNTEKRDSITESSKEKDENNTRNESPLFKHKNKKNCETESTSDSGIESRDDKNASSDESGNFSSLERQKSHVRGRSLSFDDVSKEQDEKSTDVVDSTKVSVRRQYSLREERLLKQQKSSVVLPSPVVLRKSLEKLNNVTMQNMQSDCCSSDEKISQTHHKTSRKKKIIQPLVNKIRKISRSEKTQQQQKQLMIDNGRLELIVSDIIKEKIQKLEYDHKNSNDRCRFISTTIENSLKLRLGSQPGNPEYKIVAIVYIGETRDLGICFATQCSYEPSQDLFATATYQRENMYVCATVMASLIPKL